jgi:hypothetical protein
MKSNPKSALLQRLAQGNVMFDWGAILAFDRGQVNRMLREQYMAAFNDLSFLLPFSDEVVIGDLEHVTLSDIVLGAPQVSFEGATFTNAKATVRLNIVAGTYSSTFHPPGSPPYLLRSETLREDMGLMLEMTAELGVRVGSVDDRGKLMLDLSQGERFSCNLGLSDDARLAIGAKLGEQIQSHPAYRQIYSCAMMDFNDYGPLSPRSFQVRTQPAPEGGDKHSDQYGNGAVVLFCHLRVNSEPGRMPGNPDDYPYLIPDDLTVQGAPAYNATALIAEPLRHFVDDQQAPGILQKFTLPNALQVSMVDREDPLDHVIFGSIEPTALSFFVEPLQSALLPESTQHFIIDNEGNEVRAQWQAVNINQPLATGSMQDGTYQAMGTEKFQRDQQLVLVSGRFSSAAGEQVRTGLVVESRQAVNVIPRVATWGIGMGPIKLHAGAVTGGDLSWELIPDNGQLHGDLVVDPERPAGRLFTPFDPESYLPEVRLQKIRVTDQATTTSDIATVVIFAYPQQLNVTPFHVPVMTGIAPIAFRLPAEWHEAATWKVFGEGEINEDGVYNPPIQAQAPISVVMADINDQQTGYAIVQHAYQEPPIRWTELEGFKINVKGTPICLANGMQQIPLEIVVEPKEVSVGGVTYPIPLTVTELSTMRLVYRSGNSEVEFLEPGQEGLPLEIPKWATSVKRNRFNLYGPVTESEMPQVRSEATRSTRELWLHSSVAATEEFYAKFQADDGTWWDSRDKQGFVCVTAAPVDSPSTDDYELVRQRVRNGAGRIHDPGNGAPKDEFSYMLESIDYWRLVHRFKGKNIKFATCRVDKDSAAASVRWESEQVDEVFFSYLSYAFRELPEPGQPEKVAELKDDSYLTQMAKELSYLKIEKNLIAGKEPGPGELLIMLHRLSDMPFWSDDMTDEESKKYRKMLDKPLMFVLYDQDGTRHRLRIGFPEPSIEDSRNTLEWSAQ